MTRNEEYQSLLQELEIAPPALDGTADRALRRRRRDRRLRIFGVPAGSLAACFIAFVLLVNLFPPFARACGNVPLLRALAQAVAWSPSLSAAVENDYVQPIGQSKTVNGITATVEYVIVDQKQVNIFFTLKGEGYETLSADLPEFTPRQHCAGMGADPSQPPGTLLRFSLDYQDNDVPDGFTMTFGVTGKTAGETAPIPTAPPADQSVEDSILADLPAEEPDILAEFTFDLEFDPTFTASGEIIPINSTFQLDGQTMTVTTVEVYPTHVRVNVEGDPDNTAWLKDLDFYLENEDGERFEPIANGVSASGEEGSPAMVSYRLESPWFARSDHLTLHITGALWLDRDMERIRVDLANGTADRLPEGVELAAVHRRANGTVVEFKLADPDSPVAHRQIFEGVYYLEDGTEVDILEYSWSYEEDGSTTVWMPLKDCDQDAVLLAPLFSRATAAETPVTIPIK